MFDIDLGKFVSRSLGIGEESTDEVVRIGAAIATGNIPLAARATADLAASEKARKTEKPAPAPPITGEQPMYEMQGQRMSGQIRESGGYIDIPPQGPVTEGFVGQIPNIISGVLRTLPRFSGPLVGGGATAYGLSQMMNGDACGCEPKPFVRFDKCGRPIITRKMKKQAIEMVNCSGAESAAATLTGGDANLLNMIISKQFPPMRKGISGRQLATAKRVNAALLRNTAKLGYKCTPMPSKMGVK
jgi:hypothetical protein